MPFRERLEWFLRMGLLVFILAAAAFLSAITTIRFAIRGREVNMPNLVGMKMADAGKLLSLQGLVLKVADRVYDAAPSGNVIRQSPPPGLKVKVSQDAHVVLSLGPLRTAVPQLVGETIRAARISLLQSGLQLGEVTAPYLRGSLPDTVVVQSPSPGAQAGSSHVDLLSPLGPRPEAVIMPFLAGMRGTEAQHELLSAGFPDVQVTSVPAQQWPAGTIMDQTPAAGSRLGAGVLVELKVASGGGAEPHFIKP